MTNPVQILGNSRDLADLAHGEDEVSLLVNATLFQREDLMLLASDFH